VKDRVDDASKALVRGGKEWGKSLDESGDPNREHVDDFRGDDARLARLDGGVAYYLLNDPTGLGVRLYHSAAPTFHTFRKALDVEAAAVAAASHGACSPRVLGSSTFAPPDLPPYYVDATDAEDAGGGPSAGRLDAGKEPRCMACGERRGKAPAARGGGGGGGASGVRKLAFDDAGDVAAVDDATNADAAGTDGGDCDRDRDRTSSFVRCARCGNGGHRACLASYGAGCDDASDVSDASYTCHVCVHASRRATVGKRAGEAAKAAAAACIKSYARPPPPPFYDPELDDDADAPCMKCGRVDDEASFVLCDGCPNGGHYYCLDGLTEVPRGDWHCVVCEGERRVQAAAAAAASAAAAAEIVAAGGRLASPPARMKRRRDDDEKNGRGGGDAPIPTSLLSPLTASRVGAGGRTPRSPPPHLPADARFALGPPPAPPAAGAWSVVASAPAEIERVAKTLAVTPGPTNALGKRLLNDVVAGMEAAAAAAERKRENAARRRENLERLVIAGAGRSSRHRSNPDAKRVCYDESLADKALRDAIRGGTTMVSGPGAHGGGRSNAARYAEDDSDDSDSDDSDDADARRRAAAAAEAVARGLRRGRSVVNVDIEDDDGSDGSDESDDDDEGDDENDVCVGAPPTTSEEEDVVEVDASDDEPEPGGDGGGGGDDDDEPMESPDYAKAFAAPRAAPILIPIAAEDADGDDSDSVEFIDGDDDDGDAEEEEEEVDADEEEEEEEE